MAKRAPGKGVERKPNFVKGLQDLWQANKQKSRLMYRPYIANLLAIAANFVNLMAVSDHSFRCYKLQFCTVP